MPRKADHGGVNAPLSMKFEPLLGNMGWSTEDRASAILRFKFDEFPVVNVGKIAKFFD